ncbi:MAG: glycosyltransferase [Thermoleophilia bacterium]|nr:glycosyltransferase [Thermoleophilia bacterium]
MTSITDLPVRLQSVATRSPHVTVVATTHPLTVGAAPFNTAMVAAMRHRGPVDLISWKRPYPPLLYRTAAHDHLSNPPRVESAAFILDWADPWSWRRAVRRMRELETDALVIPWLHPVVAPPVSWLLKHAPARTTRVVVCHNVVTHERVPFGDRITARTLRRADVFVTHAPHQRAELATLGLASTPIVEAFHPRFVAADLAHPPTADAVLGERARQGDPDLVLLCFGAVRPYKGVDIALAALPHVDPALTVRLVIAGRFWEGRADYEALIRTLGVERQVEIRDRYVGNDEAALLFASCDAVVLPYRSASQSGVVGLAFAHERPVIATRVGGLPEAVSDGIDGLIVSPEDPIALARAIERLARERTGLREGVQRGQDAQSFDVYAELLESGIAKTTC